MPTIATPPNTGLNNWLADEPHPGRRAPRPLMLRIRVAAKRRALSRELSEGADPAASPERAMWAAQLTTARHRWRLARSLRRAIGDAHHPPLTRGSAVLVNRRGVIDAEDALDALIKRLLSPERVSAQGMALTQRILTDGDWSPLYGPAAPGALRRVVLLATAALEPAADESRIAA